MDDATSLRSTALSRAISCPRLIGSSADRHGADFVVRYEVFDGDTLAATAATRLVTFDFASDRPRRLTEDERRLLLSYTDEAVGS